MAVFQAARARTPALPARDARIATRGTGAAARAFVRPRRIADATAAVPRTRPAAILVGVVLAAAMLGFAYLTQTLTSTTTAVAIEQSQLEQERLFRVIRTREALVIANAASGLVIDRAAELGLVETGRTIVPKSR